MTVTYSKIRYCILFFYYKFRLFLDCKKGRRRLLLAEILHIVNYLFRTNYEMPGYSQICEIETIFGKFKFIGDNYGYSILSPAFERPDKELFTGLIRESLRRKKTVLFLDIGAYVGDYSVGISLCIKGKRLTTIAFEPDIDYYKLCIANMRANGVSNYKVHNIGLSDKNTSMQTLRFPTNPASEAVTFRLQKLDSCNTCFILQEV